MATSVKDLMAAANAAVPRLPPAEAMERLRRGDALVLDVRDPNEVQASGKLKGAVNISRGLLEFRADPSLPTHHPELRPDRPVLLYCGSGGRSALAAKVLKDMGYANVTNIGGFKELAEAGAETEPA
ncbi:MAG TPA: rhodanese-like domain-containing protein [Acetobacteraceae bacterium]|nr:rhodanese-like domain-containing protein [Acetobacteraceae bacterium]